MPNYVTQCYDNLRTGWNPDEAILTPVSIRDRFCKLFSYPVQGQVYAQPLYVQNVPVGPNPSNLVFVATEENWVYAFAAEGPTQVWSRQLLPAGEQLATPSDIENCQNIQPFIGITSTPVIDVGAMTMYVCAKSRSSAGSPPSFYHRLYAIRLDTGQDRLPPVVISASVQYPEATISFNPQWQLQRPALLFMNGVIYVGFGGHCDFHAGIYHGWVIAYHALTLNQIGAFPSTLSGLGGIWQAGRGLAGDAEGWVYCQTGNGLASGLDYGNMVLKLTPRPLSSENIIEVADYFSPCDQEFLNRYDVDLGSGGPLLLPDQPGPYPHLLVAAGKEGTVYLLNRDRLGYRTFPPPGWKYPQECANPAISTLWYVLGTKPPLPPPPDLSRDALFGGPAYYAPAGAPPRIYYSGQDEPVKAFYYDQSQGKLIGPYDQAVETIPGGSIPVVSSNGGGGGVLWVVSRGNPRVLYSYNLDPKVRLAGSLLTQQAVGTWTGSLAAPATVVNGRVYVAHDNAVTVFGLGRNMSVDATLARKSGTQRTMQVTVTDSETHAPLSGVTVEVFNNSTRKKKAGGVTGGNGQVSLTYFWCFEFGNGGRRKVEDPCPARASMRGYVDEDFDTPI